MRKTVQKDPLLGRDGGLVRGPRKHHSGEAYVRKEGRRKSRGFGVKWVHEGDGSIGELVWGRHRHRFPMDCELAGGEGKMWVEKAKDHIVGALGGYQWGRREEEKCCTNRKKKNLGLKSLQGLGKKGPSHKLVLHPVIGLC